MRGPRNLWNIINKTQISFKSITKKYNKKPKTKQKQNIKKTHGHPKVALCGFKIGITKLR